MEAILSIGIGYIIGSASPATFFSKLKHVNLKEEGTGNVGATNTMLTLGWFYGALVMIIDIAKAYLSARIARALFPHLMVSGMLAGIGAILGHCYPIFHRFVGGRGLAAFGGMILAFDWKYFLIILVSGFIMMVLLDAGVAATVTGCILFPVLTYFHGYSVPELGLAIASSVLILCLHVDKIEQALRLKGGDHIVATIKEKIFTKS